MLDSETKRRIDNTRDILVGKVPDPKSQVEQITFALIYKFMDDMDQLSVSIGGNPSFFSNGYEQFAWSKLMDKRLGGEARLDLYVRALDQMSQNPYIPQLFRDVFKGAFLPYRDSETLNLFLKEINGFTYTHSEDLGDAYEYLLSVFGSQGKAGQFRTPRHIIDFIVACVNPGKDDSVLDPACGTAGFLVSAYKHILQAHTQNPLSPDEKKRLTGNFVGYDISPDMVRLSRVNMYLHQFPNPTIHEYDTLTTEDRWDDTFDVILANPPFMSPSGGIRPHKRFAVRANRSEVLFVDYIAEHLNVGGRAGVIVPEGIIFQSSNAYKALRKMLVEENYLVAVISLPAGVFNPYSGVKTSVLLLDKTLARRSESVLFVKVAADGYGLGAQRREIEPNDLPEALRLVKAFQADPAAALPEGGLAQKVSKSRLAEGGDYNLSAERYRANGVVRSKWPMVRLGDEHLFKIESGGTPSTGNPGYWDGDVPWVTLVDLPQSNLITYITDTQRKITKEGYIHSSAKLLPKGSVLISSRATIGRIAINEIELATNQGFKNIIIQDKSRVNEKFLALVLTALVEKMTDLGSGGTYKEISKSAMSTLEIPLPPLEVQREIVEEIEGYQKVIDGARQVVENYKPVIPFDPSWPLVRIGDICELNPKKSEVQNLPGDTEISFVPMADLNENQVSFEPKQTRFLGEVINKYTYFAENDVLLAKVTPCFENGKAGIARSLKNGLGFGSSEFYVLRPSRETSPEWIFYNLTTDSFREIGEKNMTGTGGLQRVPKDFISNYYIPLPPIDIQERILVDIKEETKLVKNSNKIVELFEAKITTRIQRVWEGL
jgi:type I restriction enzyme M protein